MSQLSAGDTAWVLTSAALVLLMIPGLAFFYGGLVRTRSVLNMLLMSVACLALVPILWVAYGYSLAFGPGLGAGLLGGLDHLGMAGTAGELTGTIPVRAFACFQLAFAILTPAIISGAVADRMKFAGWVVFVALWVSVVYLPVCHWVFDLSEGWIAARLGAIDFAGGTAVHVNAGAAALALVAVVGRRRGWPRERAAPHNLPLMLLGTGLLWFGWLGFDAGSQLAADQVSATVLLNTAVAGGAGICGWWIVEALRDGYATTVGAGSGAVAGLVGITPACAAVGPLGAVLLGVAVGAACAVAVGLKFRLGYDDSLDVVGVHLVGGVLGSLAVGLLATGEVTGGAEGLLYGGGLGLLARQAVAVVAVLAYSLTVSFVLALVVDRVIGLRIPAVAEAAGVDATTHHELAYVSAPRHHQDHSELRRESGAVATVSDRDRTGGSDGYASAGEHPTGW